MKKTLLYLIIFLITSSVYGQQATWNITSGTNYNWVYNFGTGTGNAGTVFSGTSSSSISTATTPGFLPQPVSGNARVSTGSSGSPSFTLLDNGTSDNFQFQASSSSTIGRFSLYSVDGATALTAYYFTANFVNNPATAAVWTLGISSGATSATSGSGVASSGTTSNTDLFGVLRFSINATDNTKMNLTYRIKETSTSTISFNATPAQFDRGTNYAFEVLCNNTSTSQDYTRDGITYTVPSRTYHVWANNSRVSKTTSTPSVSSDYDFPANQLATDSPLNSMFITGTGSAPSNDGTLNLSKISMKLANSTLPVSLTTFTGKEELGKVKLNWQTASESNNSHFEILRSSDDNLTPTKIGEVNGKGNSNTTVNYSFEDNSPLKGNNYYQLKQVDFDGQSKLSNTISIKNSSFNVNEFNVYQTENKAIIVNVNSIAVDKANLKLIGIDGQTLTDLNTQLQAGNNTIQLYSQALAKGIYLIKLDVEGLQSVKKIITN